MTPEQIRAGSIDPDEPDHQPPSFDYDLIVIGGGSGGLAAAKRAGDIGLKVCLYDFVKKSPQGTTWGLGGTCVNVGCIPKKLMHTAALHGESMRHAAPHFGWSETALPERANWDELMTNVTMHVKSLNFGYRAELMKRGVKYENALAKLIDRYTVEAVDNKGNIKRATARRILVAVGGRPTLLDIPGKEFAITSDDIFKLPRDPGECLVVGASYVALECAGFLTGIGRPATVVMRSIPLRGFDQQMANLVVEHMEKSGTSFIRGGVPQSIEKTESGRLRVTITVKSDNGAEHVVMKEWDTVLFAVGRRSDTAALGLDAVGVQHDESGKLLIDAWDRTTVPNIYAIGDIVKGGLELTPVAIAAGRRLVERLYRNGETLMSYANVPTTVFTPLEYGAVGLSEEAATEAYGMIEVYHSFFTPLEWTVPHLGDNGCYVKIIVNPFDDDRVLGFHILCPNAGEITQGVAVAIQCRATKADFDRTIGIHPVMAEIMTDLHITKSSGADPMKTGC